jgi:hypothetical protein
MPAPDQILAALADLANQWKTLAIVWHVYFIALIAMLFFLHPSRRLVGILLSLPLLSVSALAWSSGNPFNGGLFALAAIAMLILAFRLSVEPVDWAPTWVAAAGAAMFVFGWVYPHFLNAPSFVPYLYAAPVGIVPCPTLSIVIGVALMLDGLESRGWSLVLAAMGIFYALFGALRLGVTIDLVMLLGALLLAAVVLMHGTTARKQVLAH